MTNSESKNSEIAIGVNLLVSILIRYPEISTISISPLDNCLKLKFMLSAIPSTDEFHKIKQLLTASISAYNVLEGLAIQVSEIELNSYEHIAILSIIRDIKTISNNEISLITALVQEHLEKYLIIDYNDSLLEDDLLRQQEVIDNMLENIKYNNTIHPLVGIRENGRVLIFNK